MKDERKWKESKQWEQRNVYKSDLILGLGLRQEDLKARWTTRPFWNDGEYWRYQAGPWPLQIWYIRWEARLVAEVTIA